MEFCPLYIPNVFSPNGDGINDHFGPVRHPEFDGVIRQMRISDRWGDLLYDAQYSFEGSLNSSWNGMSLGKPVAPGVYVYVIEVEYPNNSTAVFWGNLTLIR
jgi:gliding motility-associated-like protein